MDDTPPFPKLRAVIAGQPLGHRSIKVTVDKYGRLTQDGRERCHQVVEAAVAPHMLTSGRTTPGLGADSASALRASRGNTPRPYRF